MLSPSVLADFRFGFFRYHVNVLPSDFGTQPAAAAGIPGLNFDNGFTSGLPAIFVGEDSDARRFAMGSGLGERVGRCNCPLDEDEKQFQLVGNVTKAVGSHSAKFGIDVRRAYNLRVPSDNHRSGELTFRNERTASPTGVGGLAMASFMLGDAYRIVRYASQTTDARERQWRHFYYAQDTWRVTPKFTASYGLRLDVINPQTVNAAGNGGFVDINTGLVNVAGEGDVPLNGGIENRLNWAPRLGATYELGDRTVIRAGYGRSYDIGVFGSLFGHTVTQNLPVLAIQDVSAPSFFGDVFNLAQGPLPPTFPNVPASGQFPLPNGVRPRVLPSEQRPPAVDAFNVMVQRQLSGSMSVEAGYVGNRGKRVFAGDNPDLNINQPTIVGFGTLSRNQRQPFYSLYGWTQDVTFYCNCATNKYDSLQARFTKRYSGGYSLQANYTLQRTVQSFGEYFQPPVVEPVMSALQGKSDTSINTGPADWDRKHSFVFAAVAEIPVGRQRRYMSDISRGLDALIGGWQVNANTFIYSGLPFNVTYRDAGADRDTGPNRPNLIGDASGPKTQDQWFNAAPIGAANSAFARPARGTFGNLERNALRGPGYWRTDASFFKHFRFADNQDVELRVEAVNIFNNVNLGNPDSEIGVPGNPNPNAGRDHVDRVWRARSTAQLPIRREVEVLASRDALAHSGEQLENGAVRPAEPNLVRAVAEADARRDVRLHLSDVVLLENRAVRVEFPGDQRHELRRDAVGILVEPVPPQAVDRDHLQRRPSKRRVPLAAGGLRARQQSARRLELRQLGANPRRLRPGGDAGPERIERASRSRSGAAAASGSCSRGTPRRPRPRAGH